MMPAVAQHWASARHATLRSRLEQVASESGKPGREALRRLVASDGEPAELRIAAIRLLDLTPGTEHLPALEAALSDELEEVRNEAFRSLAGSSSDRACDILARGVARADAATQTVLLARLTGLGEGRARQVLQRLVPQVEPQSAHMPAYLAMIAAIGRVGGAEAEPLLADVVARTRWRTPLRAWQVRSAAKAALRAVRQRGAAAAHRGTSSPATDSTKAGR